LNDVKFASKLDGAISGCPHCLQFGVMFSHFSKVMIFAWFYSSKFPICLMIICTPIPIVFFSSLLTWKFQNHFVRFKYTIRGPIGRSVICFNSHLHYSPYNDNPSLLVFSLCGKWHTYSRSCIRCGSCYFTIGTRVFKIRPFNATSEVCSLVSIGVRPLYITSYWFPYFWLKFSYFGCIGGI
jgi:hypothetical protein